VNESTESNNTVEPDKALKKWIARQLERTVRELSAKGVVQNIVVEAKPAWVMPHQLLIGKVRDKSRLTGFDWFISGDGPTSSVDCSVAATPRDAARHFALQWQLDADKMGEEGHGLVGKAEALYELADNDSLWHDYS